jgi:integral membrane protein
MSNLSTVRLIGWIEAISFLLLLFVAVPLKRIWDMPLGVRVVGPIHGVLFIVFAVMVFSAFNDKKIDKKTALLCFAGALLPLGPLLYHNKLSETATTSHPKADPR